MSYTKTNSAAGAATCIPSRAKTLPPLATPNPLSGGVPLLAQIPDLHDPERKPKQDADDAGGRIANHGHARQIVVVGVGLILVVAAIMQFAPKKKSESGDVKELPTWPVSQRPADGTEQPPSVPNQQPAGAPGAIPRYEALRRPATSTPTCLTPLPETPSSPPPPPGDPAWPPPVSSIAHVGQTDPRLGTVEGPRRNDQADLRSDPARPYRESRPEAGAGGWRTDYPAPGTERNNPMTPPPVAAGPDDSVRDPQPGEPGVARLDGTIAPPPPPVRTSYDRIGPSDH